MRLLTMPTTSYISWNNAEIVDQEQQFNKKKIKEAIRIQPSANFNQDEGLQLSRALELKCQSWNDSGIWHFEE